MYSIPYFFKRLISLHLHLLWLVFLIGHFRLWGTFVSFAGFHFLRFILLFIPLVLMVVLVFLLRPLGWELQQLLWGAGVSLGSRMASPLLGTRGCGRNCGHDLLIPVELGLAPFLEVIGDWGLRLYNLLLHRGQGLDGLRLENLFYFLGACELWQLFNCIKSCRLRRLWEPLWRPLRSLT
jgi:hypothetical protein